MISGMKLRERRHALRLSGSHVAKAVGLSVNTIYAMEAVKKVNPRDRSKLAKLLDVLGFTKEEKRIALGESVNKKKVKAKSKKRRKICTKRSRRSEASPSPAGAPALKPGPKDFVHYLKLVSFYVGDPARRSVLAELLQESIRHGITIHGLLELLGSNPLFRPNQALLEAAAEGQKLSGGPG